MDQPAFSGSAIASTTGSPVSNLSHSGDKAELPGPPALEDPFEPLPSFTGVVVKRYRNLGRGPSSMGQAFQSSLDSHVPSVDSLSAVDETASGSFSPACPRSSRTRRQWLF